MSKKTSFEWDIPLSETAETAAKANPFLQSLHAPYTYRAQRICEEHGFLDEDEDPEFRKLLEEHLKRMRAEEVLFHISAASPEEKAFSLMVMAKAQEFLEKLDKKAKSAPRGADEEDST